jgi:cysteine desulfuration protein SufE
MTDAATTPEMIAPEIGFPELAENFALFDDWDDRYRYLIDLGRKLPPLPETYKTDAYKVRGCMSQVWLVPQLTKTDNGPVRLSFAADSDAHIVKGLIAVLGVLFSGKPATEIAATDAEAALKQLGLDQHLSPSRRNGLVAMVEKIKGYAGST